MDWRDEGMLLAVRAHGETSAIAEVFTKGHGRHAGVVRGGTSRRMVPVLQPGAQLDVTWRARLGEHLGSFTVEPLRARVGLLADAGRLAALSAACALLRAALPEREPHGALWADTLALFDGLEAGAQDWALAYLRWELRLLEDLGFGLDLASCAVTGAVTDLVYVSPRTGRAVSRAGAGDWAARLLPLPACLVAEGPAGAGAIAEGLALTGHFLAQGLAPVLDGRPLPEARARLVARLG